MWKIFDFLKSIYEFEILWIWFWWILFILIILYTVFKFIRLDIKEKKLVSIKKELLRESQIIRYTQEFIINYFLWKSDWYFIKHIEISKKDDYWVIKIIDKIDNKIIKVPIDFKDESLNDLFNTLEMMLDYEIDDYFLINNSENNQEINKKQVEIVENQSINKEIIDNYLNNSSKDRNKNNSSKMNKEENWDHLDDRFQKRWETKIHQRRKR